MPKNNLILMLVLLIVVGGGAFYGGMKYQESKVPAFARNFGGGIGGFTRTGPGGGGGATNRGGSRPISGQILSADPNSITVKMTDGSSKIVLFSNTTTINKAATATATDLQVGTEIAAFGTTNADGSVTATNIQINPQMRLNPNGGQPGQPATGPSSAPTK